MLVCRRRPATHIVPGRLAWGQLRETVAIRDRRVKPGGQRAEVRGDLRRVLDVDIARREQPARHRLGDRLECVRTVRDELLEHRDRRRATALRDDLRETRQTRHGREAGFLTEEGGHLEVRVQPRLQPAIRLEQEVFAEDD